MLHFRELFTLQRSSEKSLSGIWLAQADSAAGQTAAARPMILMLLLFLHLLLGVAFLRSQNSTSRLPGSANLDTDSSVSWFATGKAIDMKKMWT